MSAILELPRPETPRAAKEPSHGGYFAYHGIWAPGVRVFRALGFSAKALIISLSFTMPALGVVGWLLAAYAQGALQARMDATRQHVEIVHGILAWAHSREASGAMTRDEAQKLALQQIKPLRYDGEEYFWINDMQPRMLMHPVKPELDGQDLSGIKDPNGLALFTAFVETVRKDGKGFVDYQWPRPGKDKPEAKISYVQGFEPWGWIVGSGVYVGDVYQEMIRKVTLVVGASAAAIAFAAYLFYSFYRVMDGGLKETRRHLRAMASGDLTTSPSPWGRDEPAQLMRELRSMQDSLRGVVERVRRSSNEIVQSSGEIENGTQDLSARTEQSAASLEKVAASMENIASTGRSSAELTGEASQVARRNAQAAGDGGRVMREVVATMEGIRTSSGKIAEIIGTIDGIAFQTNILALNAAVEAARAGEEGRGFAVVASEVRSLAQRSAGAAKEIKMLIGTSVEQIRGGTGIVQKAGATIEEIVATSRRVDELLGEVAQGAQRQSATLAEVGEAVQHLDETTQQNAALVEEAAAATSAMRDQANALATEVAHFVLPGGG